MADDFESPNVAQTGGATPEQIDALRKRYMPNAGQSAPVDPSGRPTTGTAPKKEIPFVGKEAGAKVVQSATLGWGATIADHLVSEHAGKQLRELSKNYDDAHPLAGFAIDLATTAAEAAIPGAMGLRMGGAAAGGLGMVARGAAGGAIVGGISGGSQGQGMDRFKNAAMGSAAGGALGGAAGYAAVLAKPIAEVLRLTSSDKAAADAVSTALKADGKKMSDLAAFTKQNPDARIADFSPKVADAMAKAAGKTNTTARAAGDVVRADKDSQLGRLTQGVNDASPLAKTKQDMIDNIDKLSTQRKDTYTLSKTESTAVTPELQRILDHPEVAPLFKQATKDFGAGKTAGIADLQTAPKLSYKGDQLQSVPSALLDDLQKAVGKAAEDEGVGSIRYGTLSAAQRALKGEQTGNIKNAQQLAARLGGADSNSGILGAQQFGHQYAFGLKTADIEDFRKFTPEQKEYARLGMLDGMEQYLTNAGRMTEGSLTKIADKMRDPALEEVLGPKAANDVRKVFAKEATRARVSANVEKGGNRQAAFNEENDKRMLAHGANVALGGLGHVAGTVTRLLTGHGMSEKQALSVIQIAGQPGGLLKLQQMGADKRVLDILSKYSVKGVVPGKLGAGQNERATGR